jgi:hypothetical protein
MAFGLDAFPCSVSDFGIQLVSSLHAFKLAGKTCCWLTVPLDFAHFIPVAAHQVLCAEARCGVFRFLATSA